MSSCTTRYALVKDKVGSFSETIGNKYISFGSNICIWIPTDGELDVIVTTDIKYKIHTPEKDNGNYSKISGFMIEMKVDYMHEYFTLNYSRSTEPTSTSDIVYVHPTGLIKEPYLEEVQKIKMIKDEIYHIVAIPSILYFDTLPDFDVLAPSPSTSVRNGFLSISKPMTIKMNQNVDAFFLPYFVFYRTCSYIRFVATDGNEDFIVSESNASLADRRNITITYKNYEDPVMFIFNPSGDKSITLKQRSLISVKAIELSKESSVIDIMDKEKTINVPCAFYIDFRRISNELIFTSDGTSFAKNIYNGSTASNRGFDSILPNFINEKVESYKPKKTGLSFAAKVGIIVGCSILGLVLVIFLIYAADTDFKSSLQLICCNYCCCRRASQQCNRV